jgi:PcrA/UvrD helicase-like protein
MSERPFQVGDWVRHPEFGDGLILEAKGAGEAASVVVSFPDNTRRRLMVKFANLSRLEPPAGQGKLGQEEVSKPRGRSPRKRAGG